jgi:23S rRNA (uracil1939-C5)-methyltransferase
MKLMIKTERTVGPKCRHFGLCGGCRLQHIPYDAQLAEKEAYVAACFNLPTKPILPAKSAWRYRNKMEFSFSQSKKGEKFLGLMRERGRVENLEECHLTSPWFTETLKKVRTWWQKTDLSAYHPHTNQGLMRTLILREGIRTKEKMAMLTISEAPFESAHLDSFIDALVDVDALILRKQIIKKKTPTRFEEHVLRGVNHIHELLYDDAGRALIFRIRGASFFQPNTSQAEKIYQYAVASAHLTHNDHVLDLYCGTGSLGIFASRYSKQVVGIEIIPEAVQDAKENLKLNAISNMEILEGDVGERLSTLSFQPSVVFVDPPRAGLGAKTLAQLQALGPRKIIYVSCNPSTQAADCQALQNYEIHSLQPIDQFPHTPHVENIALLLSK